MAKMNKFLKRADSGFSLIEVAIAVVIIGIITGFALKGRDLIQTVKLRAVITQVDTIKVATQMFVDKYGVFPGSLTNASDIFDNDIENGNGSDVISSKSDAVRFWKQLNAAGSLSLSMNSGIVASKVGGIFTVSSDLNGYPGTWLILCGGTTDNRQFSGILTPEEAEFVDRNCDTGEPNTGDVRVMKGVGASGECVSGDKYNFRNKSKDCVLLFRIR